MKHMIDEKMMKRLKEHSKQHKGGMNSKHMRNMKKFVKEGDSFTKAHNKAIKLDDDKEPKGEIKGKKKLTAKQKTLPPKLQKLIMKKK
jgi:hypothetical protein